MTTIHVEVLALDADVFGAKNRIHPVLIRDDAAATLVDAGYPGMFDQLKRAIEQTGISFTQIKRVIITHQDWDHTGTLPDISLTTSGQAEFYAHRNEKPYIEGTLPNFKLTPERITARIHALPEELRLKAATVFANLPTAHIHRTITDGETLPFHGGIDVIHTPGHTPGHVCLYLRSQRLLIAGDQLRVDNGVLVGPAAEHTPDMPAALQSLKKLLAYDIDSVICYHGGVYVSDVPKRIRELANV